MESPFWMIAVAIYLYQLVVGFETGFVRVVGGHAAINLIAGVPFCMARAGCGMLALAGVKIALGL